MNDNRLPLPVFRAIKQVGENISLARRARGWSQEDFALRLDVSPSTVRRLEGGFQGAALHTFLRALHLLGLLDELVRLTSAENDKLGVTLLQNQLPKHIHSKRNARSKRRPQTSTQQTSDEELEGF